MPQTLHPRRNSISISSPTPDFLEHRVPPTTTSSTTKTTLSPTTCSPSPLRSAMSMPDRLAQSPSRHLFTVCPGPIFQIHTDNVYRCDIVCARAKNHFDPQAHVELSEDNTPSDPSRKKESEKTLSYFQKAFKPLAGNAQRRMYFS
jgi:hypothetical protein